MFKPGDIVKYAPKFCGKGEEFYISKVVEEDRGAIMIHVLNTLLTLGSAERVTEEMIQLAKKYEVILNRDGKNRAYIITNTETKKFFAGYDFMGSVNWVDDDRDATAMNLDEAQQIAEDLFSED